MSKCDLQVQFDREDRTYHPGEAVRGEVVVTTDQEVSCRGLAVELLWQTHGAGNTDRQILDRLLLEPQTWSPGRPFRYPFSFTAPSTPLTYHGHFLNVDHSVAARADLPWAVDAKAREEYLLRPGPTSRADHLAATVDFTRAPAGTSGPVAKTIGWLLLPIVLVLLAALLVVLLPIVLVVGGVILARRRLAERRLGPVTVHPSAEAVGLPATGGPMAIAGRFGARSRPDTVYAISPGEPLRFSVRFQPRSRVDVDRVTARLVATEKCTSGSGTNSKTHTQTLCDAQAILAEGLPGMAGIPVELSGELQVPDLEAYSFRAASNALTWNLEVKVEVPRWPDWVRATPLALVPGRHDG
jgi:hypothetical protein